MNLPLSIIIPTYNEEKYLPKLLKSIQRQTLQPAEIIVADNSSTDKSTKVAHAFGCKLVSGGLPAKGRNNGARVAGQPLLLFLDADVILPTNKFLEKTLKEMVDKGYDITSCFITPLSKSKFDSFCFNFINIFFDFSKRFFPQINGFCIFVKRDLHKKIDGFDETVIMAEDLEYARRATRLGKFDYLRSVKIAVSVRRLKEGRIKIFLKYLLADLYFIFIGPIRTDIFKYRLGDHK